MASLGPSPEPAELADGLWRWTARHPQWHPGAFGAEVASFALRASADDAILVDPLLPADPAAVLALCDRLAGEGISILITIPYHVRSAEELRRRYGSRATIFGHAAVAKRLGEPAGFRPLEPGKGLPAGVRAHAIGRPRRYEMPLHLPSHRALAFGDSLVTTPDGELRLWAQEPVDERRARWYAERFVPTMRPLLELDVERILVTHGQPVLRDGGAALAEALAKPPWYHHG